MSNFDENSSIDLEFFDFEIISEKSFLNSCHFVLF